MEEEKCLRPSKRPRIDEFTQFTDLPYEIIAAIVRWLSTSTIVHRFALVCKQWHSIAHDDELWRLRSVLPALPSGFLTWVSFEQRETMKEQALDHLYGRSGVVQNWKKGLALLENLVDIGDDYSMALYGFVLCQEIAIPGARIRGLELLKRSGHNIARAALLMKHDTPEAYKLLCTECDASDPHVQFLLGQCRLVPRDQRRDYHAASLCLARAGSHILALHLLAHIRRYSQNPLRMETVAMFRRCAEQGFSRSQYALGELYANGTGVPNDIKKARYWMEMAAAQNWNPARDWLRNDDLRIYSRLSFESLFEPCTLSEGI
eukprot:TRINITY_DN3051_c0_g2_i1.p1 TRINITY_DN3051_c0_g2~~TRINITY_DN3051_c0_g2_i1.p1  ORF type:complete len:319 (-),score=0.27 TRINITY_DN3051_c0_g2_i1:62-1018(-)